MLFLVQKYGQVQVQVSGRHIVNDIPCASGDYMHRNYYRCGGFQSPLQNRAIALEKITN
jgi:hypothetical protein